jgi:hypothetical protein
MSASCRLSWSCCDGGTSASCHQTASQPWADQTLFAGNDLDCDAATSASHGMHAARLRVSVTIDA